MHQLRQKVALLRRPQPITFAILSLSLAEFVREAFTIVFLPIYGFYHLHFSMTMLSLAIAAHYFADTAFKGLAGHMVDRLGPRLPLLLGFIISIVSLFMMTWNFGPWWLIFMNAIYGIATSPNWPAVVTSANRLAASQKKGSIMGLVFAAWLGGAGLGPIILNFLINRHGSQAIDVLLVVLALGLAATILFRDQDLPSPMVHPDHPRQPLLSYISRVWILIPGMFTQTLALGILVPVVTLFANRILHLSHYHYSLLLVIGGGLAIAALTFTGKVADQLGPRLPLAGGFLILAIALFASGHTDSFREILPLVIVIGLSYAVVMPAWNLLLARTIPPENEGTVWGAFMAIEGLGLSVGPLVGGRLWDLYGPRVPFELSAVILGLMALFYLLYPIQRLLLPEGTPTKT